MKERELFSTTTVIKIQCTLEYAILLVQRSQKTLATNTCMTYTVAIFYWYLIYLISLLTKMAKTTIANWAINIKTLNKISIDKNVVFLLPTTFSHSGCQITLSHIKNLS